MRYLLITSIFLLVSAFSPLSSGASDFPAKEVYETYSQAVVVIRAVSGDEGGSLGTGSIISADGKVITNAHVVVDSETGKPFDEIGVFLKPRRLSGDVQKDLKTYLKASVVRYDSDLDLALLTIKKFDKKVSIIELADPDEIMVGEEVIAIGHPEQGGFWSLTYGRISGQMANQQGIEGKDVYQTDTSVNRGNSGGPLLDRRGYMVAVNTNIARLGAGGLPITGVNFSLKSEVVQRWLKGIGYDLPYGERPLAGEAASVTGARKSGGAEAEKRAAEEDLAAARAEKRAAEEDLAAARAEKKAAEAEMKAANSVRKAAEAERRAAAAERKAVEAERRAAAAERKAAEDRKAEEKNTGGRAYEKEDSKFETPKRPYDRNAALKAAEKDLENLMEEMKFKIRR